jgi:hypothetical protein
MSFAGTVVYAGAEEKYFGIIRANNGRIAGRQAQIMPTLTSTADSVAWSELSNVWSVEFARLSREYRRTVETTMTLWLLLVLVLPNSNVGKLPYLAPRANIVISPFF